MLHIARSACLSSLANVVVDTSSKAWAQPNSPSPVQWIGYAPISENRRSRRL